MTSTRSGPDAYLDRLGVGAEPPTADALFRLHRAQAERVPYETLWIHTGDAWSIDPAASLERVAGRRRGGYCYHLNGAFALLLDSLGYQVTRHVGGVHGPDGPSEEAMANHLVLTVHDLPTTDNPGGTWYVDVGLGDAMHEPLPLRAGTHRQGPYQLVLEETPGGVGDWHLTHDPKGSFAGMSWRVAPVSMDAFAERHRWLSTSPDSGFVKVLTVQRRDARGADVLRGLVLVRVEEHVTESTIASRDELADALAGRFGFDIGDIGPDALDRLWSRVHAKHLAWERAGRP